MILVKVVVAFMLAGVCFCFSCDVPESSCCHQNTNNANLSICTFHDASFKDTVRWNLSKLTPGNLDVEFGLSNVGCNKYEVYLFFMNTAVEKCDLTTTQSNMTHSRRIFKTKSGCSPKDLNERDLPTCGKTAVVTFQHVFDGWYCLKVTPHINISSRMESYSRPRYLENNHTKNSLGEFKPYFSQQYRDLMLNSQVTIVFAPLVRNQLHMDIKLIEKIDLSHGEACYKTGHEHSNCSIVNSTATQCHTIKPSTIPPNCTIDGGFISCQFFNIHPGHYCATFSIKDDRCCHSTVWSPNNSQTDMCLWHHLFSINESATNSTSVITLPKDPTDDYITYVIVGAIAAIIFLIIAILGIYLRSYIRGHEQGLSLPETPLNLLVSVQPGRIFLLYARDCQPFMELMASFREVLEDATNSEVIDCLDASRWNEVGRSPMEWVRGHIEQNNTKVVLVSTNCAYLRQQAHLDQATIAYKEPSAYDNLFIYGLKILTENLSPDIYRKISVIRFEGFSDDGNLFSHLTPYTRFVLPTHLPKLIFNLRSSALNDQEIHQVETKEVQKLNQDLTNLIDFKSRNANYIQDMITIQRPVHA